LNHRTDTAEGTVLDDDKLGTASGCVFDFKDLVVEPAQVPHVCPRSAFLLVEVFGLCVSMACGRRYRRKGLVGVEL
jgi:hypothetical protein